MSEDKSEHVTKNTFENDSSNNDTENWENLMWNIILMDQEKDYLDQFENENVKDLAKALEYAQRLVKLCPGKNINVAELIFNKRTSEGYTKESKKSPEEKKKELEEAVQEIRYFANKIDEYEDDNSTDEFVVLCQFMAQNLHVIENLIEGLYNHKANSFPLNEMKFLLAAFVYGKNNLDSSDVPPYYLLIDKRKLQQQIKDFVGNLEIHEWKEKIGQYEVPQTRFDVVQTALSK